MKKAIEVREVMDYVSDPKNQYYLELSSGTISLHDLLADEESKKLLVDEEFEVVMPLRIYRSVCKLFTSDIDFKLFKVED